MISPLLNPLPGGPGICVQGVLPLDLLPTKADMSNLPGFISEFSLLDELPTKANDPHLTGYLPIAGARLMSARACPHTGGPTHCISGALAASRSPSLQPEILDPSYRALPRGGIEGVLVV